MATFVTSATVDVEEGQCRKNSVKLTWTASKPTFKITKHTVAPSESQAAIETSIQKKRSVFLNNSREAETAEKSELPSTKISSALHWFRKSWDDHDPKKGVQGNNVSVRTGYTEVEVHQTFNPDVISEKDDNVSRRSYSILAKIPNAIDNKIYLLGERGSGFRARGEVQDFYKLRDECLRSGTLFEDPDFPADSSSLTLSGRTSHHFEWLRPSEIVDNPQMFVEGYSRFDVQQGELGDCWLLAAVANLTLYRRLFFQIVPDDQSFEDKYAGIFHFRFWQYGRWIDVVIDDRLPTYRGELVYLHSTASNEFWSALLEKAYAKLHGSYEALKGGSTCEAMEDFTGGVTEMYEMNASPPNLFKIILKAYERGSLMGASLEPDPQVLEAETREGLIRGHAYSITRVKYVDIQTPTTSGKIPLLRLRNPWGNESEWNGPWGDRSPEWQYIPDHEKDNLGLTFDNDGEFWMSYKDFQTHFNRLEICNLTPDSLTAEELTEGNKKKWEMSVFEGEWVRGVTAGGCRNYIESFWQNPQYRITLTEVDEDDNDNKCTVIIGLMQKNRRSKKLMGVEFLTIGFAVYYLPRPDRVPKPLDLNFFKYNASVARSPSFINLREVSCRFKLPPGTYCIVPSTFDPNDEGEFLLRVFSEHQNNMEYGAQYNNYNSGDDNSPSDNSSYGGRQDSLGGFSIFGGPSNPFSGFSRFSNLFSPNPGSYNQYGQQNPTRPNYSNQNYASPPLPQPNYSNQNYAPPPLPQPNYSNQTYAPPPLPQPNYSNQTYAPPPLPQQTQAYQPRCAFPSPYPTQPSCPSQAPPYSPQAPPYSSQAPYPTQMPHPTQPSATNPGYPYGGCPPQLPPYPNNPRSFGY